MMYTKAKAANLPDGVLVLEPRETYDKAVVGYTDHPKDHWPRSGGVVVVVYSRSRCIDALMRTENFSYEDAVDWYEFNTCGAWVGEQTPTFVA